MKDIKNKSFVQFNCTKNVNQFHNIQKIKGMNHQQINDLPMRELSWQRLTSGSVVE